VSRLLVLGGTTYVGRWLVTEAIDRGWSVTTFNRGKGRVAPPASEPGWLPPDPAYSGLVWTDVGRALATGLTCRPVEATVADTWEWLRQTEA
jgi:uncharacterized protein YbjT (DUF2867 family)